MLLLGWGPAAPVRGLCQLPHLVSLDLGQPSPGRLGPACRIWAFEGLAPAAGAITLGFTSVRLLVCLADGTIWPLLSRCTFAEMMWRGHYMLGWAT